MARAVLAVECRRAPSELVEMCPLVRPGEAVGRLLTDWVYRIPAIRTAEAHQRTHLYEFAWRSPAFDGEYGAGHGAELPFVFDNLDAPVWRTMVGSAGSQPLADEVHQAWIAFARTGDPGWPPYLPGRTVRRFDTASTTLREPDRARRTIWNRRR